jgi:metal-responsive CopG/Arc/MetJ family transcriptional regulator
MAESKTKKTQISIRLTDDLLDQLQKLAKEERRNRSNMVEYLLREKLREIRPLIGREGE